MEHLASRLKKAFLFASFLIILTVSRLYKDREASKNNDPVDFMKKEGVQSKDKNNTVSDTPTATTFENQTALVKQQEEYSEKTPEPSPNSTMTTKSPSTSPTLVPSSMPTVPDESKPTVSPSLNPTPSPTLMPTKAPKSANTDTVAWCVVSKEAMWPEVNQWGWQKSLAHSSEALFPCYAHWSAQPDQRKCGLWLKDLSWPPHRWSQDIADHFDCQINTAKKGPDGWEDPTTDDYYEHKFEEHFWFRGSMEKTRRMVFGDLAPAKMDQQRLHVGIIKRIGTRSFPRLREIQAALVEQLPEGSILTTHKFDDMTMKEQAEWMNSHHIIIAAHGAGLANSIFIAPETTVIQFYPRDYYFHGYFESLVTKMGGYNLDWYDGDKATAKDVHKEMGSSGRVAAKNRAVFVEPADVVDVVAQALPRYLTANKTVTMPRRTPPKEKPLAWCILNQSIPVFSCAPYWVKLDALDRCGFWLMDGYPQSNWSLQLLENFECLVEEAPEVRGVKQMPDYQGGNVVYQWGDIGELDLHGGSISQHRAIKSAGLRGATPVKQTIFGNDKENLHICIIGKNVAQDVKKAMEGVRASVTVAYRSRVDDLPLNFQAFLFNAQHVLVTDESLDNIVFTEPRTAVITTRSDQRSFIDSLGAEPIIVSSDDMIANAVVEAYTTYFIRNNVSDVPSRSYNPQLGQESRRKLQRFMRTLLV